MMFEIRSRVENVSRTVRIYDVVIFTSLLWFMVKFLRYLFPPLFDTIQVEYAITDADVGLMYTILLVTYGFMQFPSGYLSDKLNERIVITIGATTFAIASLLIFASSPYWSLIAAVVLMGIGTGMHKTVAINLISRMYPGNKGLSLGVMDTVGQGGGVFAPMVIVVVLAYSVPWRLTFVFGFVLTVLLVIGFYRSVRRQERRDHEQERRDTERTTDSETKTSSDGGKNEASPGVAYLKLFRHYHFSAFVVVSTIFTFTWVGVAAFYPLYLTRIGGLSGSTAGILYSFLFFLTVAQVVTGGLSDRFDSVRLVLVMFGMMGCGLIALVLWPSLVPLMIITLVLGVGLHGFRPVREAYLMDIIPGSIGGGGLGLVRSIMSVTGAASPAIMGLISDAVGLTNSFILLLVVVLIGVVLIVTMIFVPMPDKKQLDL